ncbi:ATP synthase gamma chain, partial [Frankliniella fusca]
KSSAAEAHCWRCWRCARVRPRHLVSLLVGLCVLYGLYVLAGTRLLESGTTPHKYVLQALGWHKPASSAPWASPSPLPRCSRPPIGSPWLLDTPGCAIPAQEPLSAELEPLVKDFPTVTCADPPPLVRSNDTHIWMEPGLVARYNASSATCCFTAMWRYKGPDWQSDPGAHGPLHDGKRHGNDIRFAKECVPFEGPTPVPHEFVRTTCRAPPATPSAPAVTAAAAAKPVYEDYHAFVPVRRPRGHPAGVEPREHVALAGDQHALSVLVLGVDSVSRLNMLRKMKRTVALLEGRLGARGMVAFNKVEDNTFPNLVPLLSGMNVPELRAACWPNDTAHFDACPWVWHRFNREGYVSMFAEDTAWMGLFHYLKRGFVNQPTDYDPRPLMYLGEKNLGRGGGYNAQYCIGQRHQIEVLFDYGRKFLHAMQAQRRKFFGLVWGTSLSHDLLNQPDEADAFYESFLSDLADSGMLNSTALVFMSDHGLRFGQVLSTFQGHLENMLPAMYVVLPEWVRRRYPLAAHNLECNRHRLVTVFDLHRTFSDFMDVRSLADERVRAEGQAVAAAFAAGRPPRGLSLFTPIPAARTCEHAGIPNNYCACQHLSKADPNDPDVRRAAAFVVEQVNAMLSARPACWRLALGALLEARRGPPITTFEKAKQKASMEYQVTLRTEPGGALFSATVGLKASTNAMWLEGSVSRLNAYGRTSWCVNSTALRPLCHCKGADLASASASTTLRL